jgi:hypothetical protein
VVFEQRYRWARAYRDGRLVAGRVRLTVDHDVRIGSPSASAVAAPYAPLSQSASTRSCAPSWSL